MKATKIFVVLAATAAIVLAAIGVAYGYYVNNQTNVNVNSPYTTEADPGFWGWLGGCLGFGPNQPYGYPYQIPGNDTASSPNFVPPQQPYQPQNPNQGYYANGYGRGCWGW
jgi:hypothetical protein